VGRSLFDSKARALRRERARRNPVLFLQERTLEEIVERLAYVRRNFSSTLLLGMSSPPAALAPRYGHVVAAEADPDKLQFEPGSFDLIIALGTLDTVDDLPDALLRLRFLLKPDSLLIGAMAGGESLPRLRQAMRAADAAGGEATPHVHPRIEPAGLAHLLTAAGFVMPVVDVDRVSVGYRNFSRLVSDLRGMGATNVLAERSRKPLTRPALAAAEQEFGKSAESGRTIETFEILHFAGWTPPADG
jgi:SAM-dependent methyltransferase